MNARLHFASLILLLFLPLFVLIVLLSRDKVAGNRWTQRYSYLFTVEESVWTDFFSPLVQELTPIIWFNLNIALGMNISYKHSKGVSTVIIQCFLCD